MNDPIKVRQPGGVLKFVQRSDGVCQSKRDGLEYLILFPGGRYGKSRILAVYSEDSPKRLIVQCDDCRGESAPPTMLFAIAETIHARLTGRDLSPTVSRAELEEEIHRVLDMIDSPELREQAMLELALLGGNKQRPAESINAELLEALKGLLNLESVPSDYGYVTFDDEDFDDASVKARTAIAHAEAQQ